MQLELDVSRINVDTTRTDMENHQIWEFEGSLWTGSAEHYRELVDSECLMVLPEPPFVMAGQEAISAVSDTPRWSRVVTSQRQVMRPQEGLIVVGYKVEAYKDDEKGYVAYCTSTYRRLAHGMWKVVQHQQTLPPLAKA